MLAPGFEKLAPSDPFHRIWRLILQGFGILFSGLDWDFWYVKLNNEV